MNLRPGQGGNTRPLRYMNNQSARLTFRFEEEFIRQSDSADALAPQHIPGGRPDQAPTAKRIPEFRDPLLSDPY